VADTEGVDTAGFVAAKLGAAKATSNVTDAAFRATFMRLPRSLDRTSISVTPNVDDRT
jgi:hypothetical protein